MTGYREKVFAIIGVKVYAAGLYASRSLVENLNAWKGRSAAEIQKDSSLFSTVFEGVHDHFPYFFADFIFQNLSPHDMNFLMYSTSGEIVTDCASSRCRWQDLLGCLGWCHITKDQGNHHCWWICSLHIPQYLSRAPAEARDSYTPHLGGAIQDASKHTHWL